jgi:Transposase DDE domain/Insertion element 4 transposase N-terminal
MPHHNARRFSRQADALRRQWAATSGLPFADLLSADLVQEVIQALGVCFRDRIFNPVITLWVFLGQIIDADHSCRQAVARLLAWLVGQDQPACSAGTGSYCQARKRLPETVLACLTWKTGLDLEARSPADWRWHGRRVRVGDGSAVSGPDTPQNQKAFPQSRSQKRGLGFPIARLLVIFSLSVGTVLEAALNPYKGKQTGETAMLRGLLGSLKHGDVLLGDRYFANYWLIALAQQHGIDVVFRQHQRRKVDFRCGRRLSRDDHVITWSKPKRPSWMDAATYASLPDTLTLRELRLRIPKGTARTREIVVVTTLLDAGCYAKGELQALYRRRWEAELNLRALKETLQMDILRCKTPAMMRKEVWGHLLVYNLIRTAIAKAAQAHDLLPWQISFKGALQTLNAFGGILSLAAPLNLDAWYAAFLEAVASHRVGNRPDRWEPRAKKRRPKPYPLLREPRQKARARLQGRR